MILLNIYTQDYDLIEFKTIISEDKLDEYIISFIVDKKKIRTFEVLEIKRSDDVVNIKVKLPTYVSSSNPSMVYPESIEWIGFYIQRIDTNSINIF